MGRWFSVDEKLPDDLDIKCVFILYKNKYNGFFTEMCNFGVYKNDKWILADEKVFIYAEYFKVTHWYSCDRPTKKMFELHKNLIKNLKGDFTKWEKV